MPMKFGTIAGVGRPVSRLILGSMIVTTDDLERSMALLDAVLAYGGNAIDTAHVYAGGNSERAIGRWLEARGVRDQVVLITKGCHPSMDRPRVTAADLAVDIYDSLARLHTDYLDAWMLHRDDPAVPVGVIMDALNEHHAAGRIHAFGGSNWTHQRLAEANAYAAAHGLVPMTVSSPNYGLAEQVQDPWGPGCVGISGPANAAARAWYQANDMPALAYSSLGRGFFSGRISRANFEETRALLDRACLTAYCHEVNFKRLDRAAELAAEKGITIPQLVLAYIMGAPFTVFPIVGAATPEEYAQNLAAFDVTLTDRERAWLDLQADSRKE